MEFNLSERIKQLEIDLRNNAKLTEGQIDGIIRMIEFMDKEFIRLLKAYMGSTSINSREEQIANLNKEMIDKLAGDKLI